MRRATAPPMRKLWPEIGPLVGLLSQIEVIKARRLGYVGPDPLGEPETKEREVGVELFQLVLLSESAQESASIWLRRKVPGSPIV